ncbi:MAG: MATE family efflux transporter [Microthrixaceae bacterium]
MNGDRSWDGEIVALAVPAAATLAAEPAYLLTDTALVGTLGTQALAGLAVANTVILAAYTVFIFLTFATTAAVARLPAPRAPADAAEEGVTATWLGAMLGMVIAAVVPLAPSLTRLFGAEPGVVAGAVTYLRISTAGFPALLIVMAGGGIPSMGTTTPAPPVRRARHGDQPGHRSGAPGRARLRDRCLGGAVHRDRPMVRRPRLRRPGRRRADATG